MSVVRGLLVIVLAAGPSACASSVATLSGVVVGGELATGSEVTRVRVVGSDGPEPTRLGMSLRKGDTISTGPDARALLVFQEEWEVGLDSGTSVYVSNPKAWLRRGRIFVKKLVERAREAFEVEDERRVFGAEGTQFVLESDGDGGVSVSVLEGRVRVGPKDADWEPVEYGPLERGHLQGDEPPERMASLTQVEAESLRTFVRELEELSNVRVPDVVGLPRREATQTLQSAGLVPGSRVPTRITGQVPSGAVVEQSPLQGTAVRAGTQVDLVVEAPSARVPSLVGRSRDEAERALRAVGLGVGSVREVESADSPPGTVVRQSRSADALVEPGASVDLSVAVEPRVSVPRLVGLTLAAARVALGEAELVPGQVGERRTLEARAGTVVDQSPSPGTRLAPGSAVQLVVAVAPPFCVVPRLVGRSEEEARELLREAGLAVGEITVFRYPPRDQVTGQAVEAGERIDCGTAVSFMMGTIGVPREAAPGPAAAAGAGASDITGFRGGHAHGR